VHDTGPGVPAAALGRLFQRFTQVDESTTRRFGGTGLGLSICRELARLMGGQVGADSHEGTGSCFWAEIPLAPTSAAPAAPAAQAPDLDGLKVLLVEDNPVNMTIAAALLERWGVKVFQAEDGQQAIDLMVGLKEAGTHLDAVLMDVQMPGMSGYEACRRLKSAHGPALPVIALTAAALVTERAAAIEAGMQDFLTKPIDPDRLAVALARWTGRAGTGPAAPSPAGGGA
jgi:CheY-like chemotaxis protein